MKLTQSRAHWLKQHFFAGSVKAWAHPSTIFDGLGKLEFHAHWMDDLQMYDNVMSFDSSKLERKSVGLARPIHWRKICWKLFLFMGS